LAQAQVRETTLVISHPFKEPTTLTS
jgi:hypothetical protein